MVYNKMSANNGVIFKHACDILSPFMQSALTRVGTTSGNLDASLIIPIAVNASFACELFLKALIPSDKIPKGRAGHKLNALYELIEETEQDKIRTRTIDAVKIMIPGYDEKQFQMDLDNNAEDFVKCRYFHEGNMGNVANAFLDAFMRAICVVVQSEC